MEYLTLNSFETKRSVTIDSLKTHFLPIQEGEGDPSPENVRPITGWNSIKIRKTGKNLAKIVGYSAITNVSVESLRVLTNNYGTAISTINYSDELIITQSNYPDTSNLRSYKNGYFTVVFDNLPFNKAYNISFKISNITSNPLNAMPSNISISNPNGNIFGGAIATEDGHLIFKNINYRINTSYPGRCGFSIYNCGMSFTLSEFMITAVEDEDFTYEPYREEEVEVELPETIYGGYVDIAKGELVQEWECVELDTLNWYRWCANTTTYPGSTPIFCTYDCVDDISSVAKNYRNGIVWLVSGLKHSYEKIGANRVNMSYTVTENNTFAIAQSGGAGHMSIRADDYDNVEDFLVFLKGKTCAYPKQNPIHYPLSPETLKTLRGFNTVFSTTNDTIEVGYSEMSPTSLLKRRRDIIASEPHLVTVETGNTEDSDIIASFKTNTALPLKSMVTNFEPKQEGEGDPSPENIRPITGLSELEIHNEDRVYNIPLTLPNLITPEPKSVTSYNVDFTVNEDGTVEYEGTPTSYSSVYVGCYYIKGGEIITVTICGDNANICFNSQWLSDSNGNIISFLESDTTINYEGKKTYTIDLSNYPNAYKLQIILKRMSNDVYMKGKCWVRVVEGTADTGDEVFGGYVDLDNNEFVKTWECVGLDSLSWGTFTANTTTYPNAVPVFRFAGLASDISTEAKDYHNGVTWYVSGLQNVWISGGTNITSYSAKYYPAYDKDLSFVMAQSGSKGYLGIRADHIDNVADLKYFLQGKKFAYPKEVPVHFPLSPTVIRTLKGTNNIYTNSNGKSIIKYWTH